jgi:hypothetical protein
MKWSNFSHGDSRTIIKKLKLEKTDASSRDEVYWYYVNGVKILRVTMPNKHKASSLSSGFITQIRMALKLNTRQFEDLVDCPLSAEDFESLMRELGLVK